MQKFLDHYIYPITLSNWLIAGLCVWVAVLLLFIVYMMLDAPVIDESSNEQEYRSDYDEDGNHR